ncbi:MAG: hypothetical protein ACM3RP_01010 [Chitinophagales bacterium]
MLIDRQTLLGIGVGLLLAATLSAVAGHQAGRVSDLEVIRRAKELGMSFPGEQRAAGPAPASARQAPAPAPDARAESDTVTVAVPQGASVAYVARLLSEKSLIADETEFLKVAGERNVGTRFKPGTYRFPRDVRVRDLVSVLLAGPEPQ